LAFFVFISGTVDLLLMISSQSVPVTSNLNPLSTIGLQSPAAGHAILLVPWKCGPGQAGSRKT
jgi:hypothetical protein